MSRNSTLRLLFAFLPCLFIVFSLSAQNPVTKNAQSISYAGGMFYGSGYFSMQNDFASHERAISGLGGRLFLNTSDKFRIGGMGSSIIQKYDAISYFKVSYGGLSGEFYRQHNQLNVAVGLYGGGGAYKNLHLIENQGVNFLVNYSRHGFYFISPMFTAHYQVTGKISTMLTMDYLKTNTFAKYSRINGLNVRLGIVFIRG